MRAPSRRPFQSRARLLLVKNLCGSGLLPWFASRHGHDLHGTGHAGWTLAGSTLITGYLLTVMNWKRPALIASRGDLLQIRNPTRPSFVRNSLISVLPGCGA